MSSAPESIICSKVIKKFNGIRALDGVNIRLNRGEITALTGANGSGKTTLIHIIATILAPCGGTIKYCSGKSELSGAGLRRIIGLVSQFPLLYPDLSALENLDFIAGIYGINDSVKKIPRALKDAGLPESAWERSVRTYSRGMLQQTSIARVLLTEPAILLLDEPFAGLDSESSGYLKETIRKYRDTGKIVLFSTHDPSRSTFDRKAVLERGRIIKFS